MQRLNSKLLIIGIAIFAASIGGFFALSNSKPTASLKKFTPTAWRVSSQFVSLETVSPVFNGFGKIENPDTQTIKARIATDVIAVYVKEGGHVKKGDLLIKLDSIDVDIKRAKARSNIANARLQLITLDITEAKDLEALEFDQEALKILTNKLSRITDLRKSNLSSEQDLDIARQAVVQQKLQINRRELALATVESKRVQAMTAIEQSEVELRAALRDFKSTLIFAPTNGQLISVSVLAGDRISAHQNLMTFAPNSGREVRVQVPASVGQRMSASLANSGGLSAQTDRGHQLRLMRVSGAVQHNTGSIDVFFTSDQSLPATGTVLSVAAQLPAQSEVVVLPTDALYGGNLIYRITDGNLLEALTIIRLGQRPGPEKTEVLIRSDKLQDGDQILTSRLPAAVSGLRVEAIQ